MKTLESIATEAMLLPEEDRLILTNQLLGSVETQDQAEIDAAWAKEIQERIRRFERGETKATPTDEVFAKAEEMLRQMRKCFR